MDDKTIGQVGTINDDELRAYVQTRWDDEPATFEMASEELHRRFLSHESERMVRDTTTIKKLTQWVMAMTVVVTLATLVNVVVAVQSLASRP